MQCIILSVYTIYRHLEEYCTRASTFAKSIDPRQPAKFAQADVGRYFLLLVDFLLDRRQLILRTHPVVRQNRFCHYSIAWLF